MTKPGNGKGRKNTDDCCDKQTAEHSAHHYFAVLVAEGLTTKLFNYPKGSMPRLPILLKEKWKYNMIILMKWV